MAKTKKKAVKKKDSKRVKKAPVRKSSVKKKAAKVTKKSPKKAPKKIIKKSTSIKATLNKVAKKPIAKKTAKKTVAKKKATPKKVSVKKTTPSKKRKSAVIKKKLSRKRVKMEMVIAEGHHRFWVTYEGPVLSSLEDLAFAMNEISKLQYDYHAKGDVNDFVSWVEYVLADQKCALELSKAKTRSTAKKSIDKALMRYK